MTADERKALKVGSDIVARLLRWEATGTVCDEAAGEIHRLRAALAASEAENFKLAAMSCICVNFDEYGNAYCEMQQKLAASEAKLEKAATMAKTAWLTTPYGSIADADAMEGLCHDLSEAIRAMIEAEKPTPKPLKSEDIVRKLRDEWEERYKP
jgi:hypothetical protein